MIRSTVRRVLQAVAPEYASRTFEKRWLRQHAVELSRQVGVSTSLDERVDIARANPHLRSNQKRAEILGLLTHLEVLRPRVLAEIGADRGGTLALFASVAAPDARILSLDIHYPASRAAIYRILAQPGQTLTCLECDSHAAATVQRVRQWLNGDLLDFLFIDGDHSFDGVKADYEMYGPLVRQNGIIAFHDIVPDFRTRFGQMTPRDAGDVPRYWSELRPRVTSYEEFIENPDQDGYGIGMIRVGST